MTGRTKRKFNKKQILKILKYMMKGLTNIEISEKYNISTVILSGIRTGKKYTDIERPKNYVYKYKRRKCKHPKGSKHSSAKLTENDIPKIRKMLKTKKYTLKEIGEKFNVSLTTIFNIKQKKIWTHVK